MISECLFIFLLITTIKGQSGNCVNDDLKIITGQGDRCLCPEGFLPSNDFLTCRGCSDPLNVAGFILKIYSNKTQYGYAIGSIAAYYPPDGNRVVLESLEKGIMCRYENGVLQWSNFTPYSYETIYCDPPFVGHPTLTTITGNWRPGTVATYACPVGYVLVGNTSSTCNSVGTFEPSAPYCQPIECDAAVLRPLRSTFSILGDEPYVVENFLSISCLQSTPNVRKLVNGENFYRCGSDGQFYPTINAVCIDFNGICTEGVTCLNGGKCIDEAHRSVQLTPEEAAIDPDNICSCPLGFHGWNCGQRNYCPRITGILNGVVRQQSISHVGDRFTVVCNSGFQLSGSQSVRCNADGTWSEDIPTCEPIGGCSVPPEINDGYVFHFTTYNHNTAFYSCDFVCFLVGLPVVECVNGAWSHIPSCNCASCTFPSTAGLRMSVGTTSAQYSCPAERMLHNSEVLQCVDGQIVGTPPTCSSTVTCGMPQPISNGQINNVTSVNVNGIASFFCNPGFRLEGTTKTCNDNGQWVGEVFCVLDNCGRPEADFFTINPVLDVYSEGSTVTITPNPNVEWGNYPSNNPVTLTCVDGFWNPPVPTKRATFNCPVPVVAAPLRADVNSRNNYVEYSCDTGYEVDGNRISLCINGALDTAPPSCRVVGSSVTCLVGQTLVCPIITDQLNTGCVCYPVTCNAPIYPKFGGYTTNGYDYGSVVTYSCYGNRQLSGVSRRTCGPDGEWSDNDPLCIDAPICPTTGLNIDFGSYAITTYGAETFAMYKCNAGYKLLQATYRVCQPYDSTWSTPVPVCESISTIRTPTPTKVGPPGLLGHRGPGGNDGNKGDQGLKGYKGLTGYKGLSGDIGTYGRIGATGTNGPKGEKGVPGRKGIIGIKGIIGDVGPRGPRGNEGTRGFIGSKGTKGVKGRKGISAILAPPIPTSICASGTCPDKSICIRQINVNTGVYYNQCICMPGVNLTACSYAIAIKKISATTNRVCLNKQAAFIKVDCVPGFSNLSWQSNFSYFWNLAFANGSVYQNITTSTKYVISADRSTLSIMNPEDDEDGAVLTCTLTNPPSTTFAITTTHHLNLATLTTTECNQTCGNGKKFMATRYANGSYCSIDYENPIPCGSRDTCNRCASCYNGNCNIKSIDNCSAANQQCIKYEINNRVLHTGCDYANFCPSNNNINIINVKDQPLTVTCCRGQMCNDYQ